jgi:GDPmannose 4,6-dehydratase
MKQFLKGFFVILLITFYSVQARVEVDQSCIEANKALGKKALIVGITGQDGSYLAEFLLNKGYQVHGVVRRSSTSNLERLENITAHKEFFLHHGDLVDGSVFHHLVKTIMPDEVYNLGAQSNVKTSFEVPEYTGEVTGLGTLHILEAIRQHCPETKFYQASTSEMFGKSLPPQNEQTTFLPCSPYAVAKLYSHWITVNYRESYGLFACSGILFNHESPRRGTDFVTRKITTAIANIVAGKEKKLYLGNLDAKRDWGFAPEYVEAMWLMLQRDTPEDFVIGTGESHSVREFVEKAFSYVGIQLVWSGSGIHEKGIVFSADERWQGVVQEGACLVEVDPQFFRPSEVEFLQADMTKAQQVLGWQPQVRFDELVKIMVDDDLMRTTLRSVGVE